MMKKTKDEKRQTKISLQKKKCLYIIARINGYWVRHSHPQPNTQKGHKTS